MSTPAPACKKALTDATLRWPDRNRASDGIMGDSAHSKRKSDHNLGNAVDLTHDPLHGVDCFQLRLRVIGDPRVTYVIFNGQIYKTRLGKWETYRGPNPHRHHMHVSIKPESRDDLSPWPWSPTTAPEHPTLRRGDKGDAVEELQDKLNLYVLPRIMADGIFGPATEKAVKYFQRLSNLEPDGIVGPAVWEKLG